MYLFLGLKMYLMHHLPGDFTAGIPTRHTKHTLPTHLGYLHSTLDKLDLDVFGRTKLQKR